MGLRKDGIDAEVYGDGSIGFAPRSPGCTTAGVNERHYEQNRIGLKRGLDSRNGQVHNRHFVNVVTCRTATILKYRTVNIRNVDPDGPTFVFGFLYIDSDMDRAHMPQTWAAGILPVLPADRFHAWYTSTSPNSGDIVRFNPPTVMDADGMRALETYLLLVIDRWTWGIRVQDATRMMQNLGFGVTSRDVRKAFDHLVEQGLAVACRVAVPVGNEYAAWRPSARVLTFQQTLSHPVHDLGFEEDSEPKRAAGFNSLFEAFVPYLRVPVLPKVAAPKPVPRDEGVNPWPANRMDPHYRSWR